jgi:hypothetical protein
LLLAGFFVLRRKREKKICKMKHVKLLPNCFIETDLSLGRTQTQNKISDFGQEELLGGSLLI